jgi:dipeptidyl aminopeptidase/acylaminoacyl peptidase
MFAMIDRFWTARLSAGVLTLALLAPAVAGAAAETELIPRDVFFGNPDRAMVTISPDGSRLAYLAPHNGLLNVWVQTVGQDDARAVTSAAERPIRRYFWAENGEQIIYAQDAAGNENFHLYAVDLVTNEERDLTPYENVQARLVAMDQSFPDEILVGINNRDASAHDIYRVNTRTGESALVYENTAGYARFIADSAFNIRVAMRMTPDGGMDAFIRPDDESEWVELAQWGPVDAGGSGPAGFTRDGKMLYVIDSRNAETSRLYSYMPDTESGQSSNYKLIASSDKADLSPGSIVAHPGTGKIQAVGFEHARLEWEVLDPLVGKDWKYLESLADGEMNVLSRSSDDARWVVAFLRDDGPMEYWLYERPEQKAQYLFSNRAALEKLNLAKMEPAIIKSRDGLNLVSYLTTPVGKKAKKLPMVLLVHGGPWSRDSWGYNPLHQWLANRGYAVLSVNFRGSTGLGKSFMNAGNREWAGRMHDDLIDAVNWVVEQGIADPDRVAIMGGSYGGYATLVGLTFTPDFFAAGVDIVGPSHVGTLLESIPPYWAPIKSMFEARVGSLDEPEYLDRISPLTRVDKISKPLLIGQGANDPRVKEAESRQIVEAMQAKDLPVTYVLFPDEGHGFARPQNSKAFFAITEAFLAEHLGGRYEPLDDELANSSAVIEAGAPLIPGLDSGKVSE